MNTVRIGVITVCAAVGASGYLSLRDAATDEAQPAQATRAQTANFAASHQAVSRQCGACTAMRERSTRSESLRSSPMQSDTDCSHA